MNTHKSKLLAIAILLISSCSNNEYTNDQSEPIQSGKESVENDSFLLTEAEQHAITATQNFNYDFFKAVTQLQANENVVVSPLSAQLLLSMLANAAESTAASEITAALGFSDIETLNAIAAKCLTQLPLSDEATRIALANSIWYADRYRLNTTFSATLSDFYAADNFARDFMNGETIANEINAWCADKTGGVIPEILNTIPQGIEAIMANAMYFKGQWANPFSEDETTDQPFYGAASTRTVRMMHNEDIQHYAKGDDYDAVKIEMGNGTFAVTFILPEATADINDFISHFDYAALQAMKYRDRTIDLSLPCCKLTPSEITLKPALRSLGVNALFDDGTFTLFTEKMNAALEIKQKSAIEFNEKGAEGASVTWNIWQTSGLEGGKVEIPIVNFNRPFLFFVNETKSGICLMAGKVMNL